LVGLSAVRAINRTAHAKWGVRQAEQGLLTIAAPAAVGGVAVLEIRL
jgi:hypothetical protein